MDEKKMKEIREVMNEQEQPLTELDIDVTLNELRDKDNPWTKAILDEIEKVWVGEDKERADSVRCGTIYITNKDGLGEVRLALRFTLDLDRIYRDRGIEDEDMIKGVENVKA